MSQCIPVTVSCGVSLAHDIFPVDDRSGIQVSFVSADAAGRKPVARVKAAKATAAHDKLATNEPIDLEIPVDSGKPMVVCQVKCLHPPKGSFGPQYQASGSVVLTYDHLDRLRNGQEVCVQADCTEPDETASLFSFDSDPIMVGKVTVRITPSARSGRKRAGDSVAGKSLLRLPSRESMDALAQQLHEDRDTIARIQENIRRDRMAAYQKPATYETFISNTVPEVDRLYPSEYDSAHAQPEATEADTEVLHNVLLMGCLHRGVTEAEFIKMCKSEPSRAANLLVSGICITTNGGVKYQSDIDVLNRPGEAFTCPIELASSCEDMGLSPHMTCGDCEDSSHMNIKLFSAFRNCRGRTGIASVDAAVALAQNYETASLVCSTNTSHVQNKCSAGHMGRRSGEQSIDETVQMAKQNEWSSTSGTHSTAAIFAKGTLAAMIQRGRSFRSGGSVAGSPNPKHGGGVLMEGTGLVLSDLAEGSCDLQKSVLIPLAEQVRKASDGNSEFAIPSPLGEVEFYRSVTHTTAPDGKAYYFSSSDKEILAPNFISALDHPERVALIPMNPTANAQEQDAARRGLLRTDFVPLRLQAPAAGSRKPTLDKQHGVAALVRGEVLHEEKEHGTIGGRKVHVYDIAKGLQVRVVA